MWERVSSVAVLPLVSTANGGGQYTECEESGSVGEGGKCCH